MTLELIFIEAKTGQRVFEVTDIVAIRWITPSEIGFTKLNGALGRCTFRDGEKLEINRIE